MVLRPARVVVAWLAVSCPVMVVEADTLKGLVMVEEPVTMNSPMLVTVRKVEVAPVLVILKRSASCPLALRMTKGMELTLVPAVEVASTVKTALAKGEDVPTVNCF